MNTESSTSTSFVRSAGILLHPTSFNTPYGIGDLGPQAFEFVQFLENAGQRYWQMLPLGPTGYADSPYQTLSAFAGNPLLISPDGLIQLGLLTKIEVLGLLDTIMVPSKDPSVKKWTQSSRVEYSHAIKLKESIFISAFEKFHENSSEFSSLRKEFGEFCEQEASWLEEFVLFYSLKAAHDMKAWVEWPKPYVMRDQSSLNKWKDSHAEELEYYKFIQWIFYRQWRELKAYANAHGVKIIGDMPIFVAHDSVDVWMDRELFTVDSTGQLTSQAGVPPDYFSKTGQLWGNPLYKWKEMAAQNYKWFIQRFKQIFQLCDWIRIDHFRGFQAYWEIPAEAETAITGKWVKAPGKELFIAVKTALGNLPIIAEDLGVITPEVDALRHHFGFPGMKVLQFAFTDDATNPHLPHNISPATVAYTGTHDNDTSLGWWENHATKSEIKYAHQYIYSDGSNIVDDMVHLLYRTVAVVAIIPFQDVLGEGSEARMNVPSFTSGNWQYKMPYGVLTKEKAKWLRNLTKIYGRNNE
ncbi:MAG: 4-alpha-glucanotransferase [Promethearchaeota archaeon]